MAKRVVVFDSSSKVSLDHYRWLYTSVALGAASEHGDKGVEVAEKNAEILDKLDSISDECEVAKDDGWVGVDLRIVGYNARVMHSGRHEVAFKSSEHDRLTRLVDTACLRFNSLVQRKFFAGPTGLFEFLAGAERVNDVWMPGQKE